MNKQVDRRVMRTRKLIRDALTELIIKYGLEKVTVSKLTEEANINRGTFYLHYKGIHDLVEKSEAEIIEQILSLRNRAIVEHKKARKKEPSKKIIYRFAVELCNYFKENCAFLNAMLGPNGDPSFQEKLKSVLEQQLLRGTYNYIKIGENTIIPNDYLIAYLSSAHIGIIQHWLKNGADMPAEEIAKMITELSFNGPIQLSHITPFFHDEK